MTALDVRRLAALDMWGSAGAIWRRRLIRAEFVIGAVGCSALGLLSLVAGSSLTWVVAGAWLLGVGTNYVPLAAYAEALARPGQLEAELRGVDLDLELRSAGRRQLWILVPFAVAIAALARRR